MNPNGIGREHYVLEGSWRWKIALRAGTVLIPFISNHPIRRIHSSVKHSFPYEVSLPCVASFLSTPYSLRSVLSWLLVESMYNALTSQDSSVGRAPDWKSGCPQFDSASWHFSFLFETRVLIVALRSTPFWIPRGLEVSTTCWKGANAGIQNV